MLDRLFAVEVAGLPDSALAADLVGLRVAVSRLEAEFARRLVVFDRRGAAGVTGAVSTAAWLRGACRLSAGEAGERVRTARVLADDLPVTAAALAAGDLSYAHARVLAAAAPELPVDALGALEPVLVEAARHADPARLRAVLADLRAHADPAGAAAAAHDRRRLTVAGTFAGAVVLDGVLDPEGGATVLAALARWPHPAVLMMTAARSGPLGSADTARRVCRGRSCGPAGGGTPGPWSGC
jgi:hypothetical protein